MNSKQSEKISIMVRSARNRKQNKIEKKTMKSKSVS